MRRRSLVPGIAALAAGAIAGGRRRRAWRQRVDASDPCGPHGLEEPEGEELVVRADDGAELAVLVAGPADGPTVVLPHCWTGTRRFWAPVARRLVLGGHRVVLYDQRGHGQSTAGELAPSIDVLGHDLRAVMGAVDAHGAVLAGHSMGGMTIQSYAALHEADFVERVAGVVLVATAAKVVSRPVPAAVIDRLLADGRAEWTRRGRIGRATVRRSVGTRARRAHVEATLEAFAATPGAARAGFLSAMVAMDLREGLGDLAVPATVMVGTHDRLTPLRLARHLAEAIPRAGLVVLPGAGHMLPLEEPDRIVDEIKRVEQRAAAVSGARDRASA